MILVDTNVISEVMKATPDSRVKTWLDRQNPRSVFVSSISVAELGFGVAVLSPGRRREQLSLALDEILRSMGGRVLTFDLAAAHRYAELAGRARAAGLGFPMPDGWIAAIAAAQDCVVATRDTSAFRAAGLTTIDPWTAEL